MDAILLTIVECVNTMVIFEVKFSKAVIVSFPRILSNRAIIPICRIELIS